MITHYAKEDCPRSGGRLLRVSLGADNSAIEFTGNNVDGSSKEAYTKGCTDDEIRYKRVGFGGPP